VALVTLQLLLAHQGSGVLRWWNLIEPLALNASGEIMVSIHIRNVHTILALLAVGCGLPLSMAREAYASWWGPPDCDDTEIINNISEGIKALEDQGMARSAKTVVGIRLAELHYKFITKSYVELGPIREVEQRENSRLCSTSYHYYLDKSEGEKVVEALKNDEMLGPLFGGVGALFPEVQALLGLYDTGVTEEFSYEVYYDTKGAKLFKIISSE
jgi:hypothetical protein